ncbi:MAG: hypothetical protein JNL77_07045 [Nitrosomonas sp.]|nr:hypothetical protein [Nitrosomonas sp.]
MVQSNVIGLINKLKIPRWIYSDGVPVALSDPETGLVVPQTNSVANWTALQAIPKVAGNDCLTVFVSGMGPIGMFWTYRHITGMWHVPFPQLPYNLFFGSIASPACVIGDGVTVATLFNTGITLKIPANMLRVGSQIRIVAEIAKTQGAAHSSAVGTIYMGTNGSASDSSVAAGTIADADKSTLPMQPRIRVVDTGRITTTYSSGYSAGGSGVDGILDKTTGIAIGSDMYVTVGIGTKAVNDVYKLLMLQVWIDAI